MGQAELAVNIEAIDDLGEKFGVLFSNTHEREFFQVGVVHFEDLVGSVMTSHPDSGRV